MQLETFSIPVLMKAVDFLFDETKKILEERRLRRAQEQKELVSTQEIEPSPSINENIINTKEVALQTKIDEARFRNSEVELQHLLTLKDTYTKNYHLAKEKYARWGSALVPPIIVHELNESENEILKIAEKLQDILGEIYDKPITLPELFQEE